MERVLMILRRRKRNFTRKVLLQLTQEQYDKLQGIAIVVSAQEGKRLSISSLLREAVDAYISLKETILEV